MTTSTSVRDNDDPIGPPPPFDAELEPVVAAMLEQALSPDDIAGVRASMAIYTASDDDLHRAASIDVEERVAPGPDGAPDLSLVVCRPKGHTAPLPAIFYIHGGGMYAGDRRTGLDTIVAWIDRIPMVVVSVEYRLAPEHPHPAPVEDCYAGLVWTAGEAVELGIDPNRILVVGSSAGGGLAAGVVLLARDRGGPVIAGQMLGYPMLDDRNNSASGFQMDGVGIWDRAANATGWQALLGDRCGGPDVSHYAAPARATHLGNLPATFIDVGSAETFRDEAVRYAERIWRAGGRAELHVWPGGFHAFDGIVPDAVLSRDAQRARFSWLERLIG